ncbi:stage II sporulation protein R [Tumebacillus sp. BK434]|uniref:stage II sporulation protein R n=1 Tax=Tumebacillus sp. BK434 TaxID=2512169 RepID=UPI0010CE5349|nr:stage II sporulation protein R [Tumebacillus sp. BK434]TCP57715.1 stage II sporulation protein R [Tumebacillus sp. BK434]
MRQELAMVREAVEKVNKRAAIALLLAAAMIGIGVGPTEAQDLGPVAANVVIDDEMMQEQVQTGQSIPGDAIRLRIIANSDSAEDQQLKRDIRDEIIAAIAVEVEGLKTAEAAREQIRAAVPEMNEIAKRVIEEQGYSYPVATDFGLVPFPTKMYGTEVYPAGEYEALRIQVGEAKGQNWWCVLFPPLCFVDMSNGDAVKAKDMETAAITTVAVKDAAGGEQEVEVRSALFDKIASWWDGLTDSIGGFFA